MSLYQVRLNFIYKLEGLALDFQRGIDRNLINVDRLRLGGEASDAASFGNSVGRARDFVIKRTEGVAEPDDSPSNVARRSGHHTYEFKIAYPTAIGTENDIHEAIDRDRHQILEALRLKATYVGIPGTGNGSTDVGLKKRQYMGDELEDDGAVWVQRYVYDSIVWEDVP